jgi:hypothetical protein
MRRPLPTNFVAVRLKLIDHPHIASHGGCAFHLRSFCFYLRSCCFYHRSCWFQLRSCCFNLGQLLEPSMQSNQHSNRQSLPSILVSSFCWIGGYIYSKVCLKEVQTMVCVGGNLPRHRQLPPTCAVPKAHQRVWRRLAREIHVLGRLDYPCIIREGPVCFASFFVSLCSTLCTQYVLPQTHRMHPSQHSGRDHSQNAENINSMLISSSAPSRGASRHHSGPTTKLDEDI